MSDNNIISDTFSELLNDLWEIEYKKRKDFDYKFIYLPLKNRYLRLKALINKYGSIKLTKSYLGFKTKEFLKDKNISNINMYMFKQEKRLYLNHLKQDLQVLNDIANNNNIIKQLKLEMIDNYKNIKLCKPYINNKYELSIFNSNELEEFEKMCIHQFHSFNGMVYDIKIFIEDTFVTYYSERKKISARFTNKKLLSLTKEKSQNDKRRQSQIFIKKIDELLNLMGYKIANTDNKIINFGKPKEQVKSFTIKIKYLLDFMGGDTNLIIITRSLIYELEQAVLNPYKYIKTSNKKLNERQRENKIFTLIKELIQAKVNYTKYIFTETRHNNTDPLVKATNRLKLLIKNNNSIPQ